MKKYWPLAVGLVLLAALVGLLGCAQGATLGEVITGQQEGIWVNGQGEVSVAPDILSLRLGVEAQQPSVAEAQAQATEAMNRVKTALTDNGIAEKDIQTQQFSIVQVTKWDEEKKEEVVIGYRVTNMVTAKIRDMDKAGAIIDAVAAAGGDLTRIDSLSFSIDDPSTYYGQARDEAMADAKAKAQQLADLSGVTLGKPTYISESTYTPSPSPVRAEASTPATPISPGEMKVTLTVQVVYKILQ